MIKFVTQAIALLVVFILLLTITTPILFIMCIKKKSKKPAVEPTSEIRLKPPGVAMFKTRQRPISGPIEDDVSKSKANPSPKDVEFFFVLFMLIAAAAPVKKDTVAAPLAPPPAPEKKDEDSVDEQRSEESETVD